MNEIYPLINQIKNYAWGSQTALPKILGRKNAGFENMAEYWMGTHPAGPSRVLAQGKELLLSELIAQDPKSILGSELARLHNNTLPFLFKIIAVEKCLSLQAHPSKTQAEAGFASENRLNIPVTAPERNYRDDNAKPEIICAITPFSALAGFRPHDQIISAFEAIKFSHLQKELSDYKINRNEPGLKIFFKAVFGLNGREKKVFLKELMDYCLSRKKPDKSIALILNLLKEYPDDAGCISPLFLNDVQLKPREAMFIPAGLVHAYYRGTGFELMSNSDNVLRCGLTIKHIDLDEFSDICRFVPEESNKIRPDRIGNENAYPIPVKDFLLSDILVKEDAPYVSRSARQAEILFCLSGAGKIILDSVPEPYEASQGMCFFIPSDAPAYRIEGRLEIFKATMG
ncbi:MAG: mannose-6-phosphate isomerase, class I [Spirochaetales bacterium]|nr:mannose-6-phosphate isomerase, class I [Spirochaetales bacterium]